MTEVHDTLPAMVLWVMGISCSVSPSLAAYRCSKAKRHDCSMTRGTWLSPSLSLMDLHIFGDELSLDATWMTAAMCAIHLGQLTCSTKMHMGGSAGFRSGQEAWTFPRPAHAHGAAMRCRSLSLLLGLRQLQGLVLRDQRQAGIGDGLDAVAKIRMNRHYYSIKISNRDVEGNPSREGNGSILRTTATSDFTPGGPKHVRTKGELWDRALSFGPQRRAPFRHLNFQKCSDNEVFLAFWLRNVLRATTACNFSSLSWPDGSAPATLPTYFSTPPSHKTLEKQWFVTFRLFRAPASSFFWVFLPWSSFFFSSLLWLFPPLHFHRSILSEVWLLNFLR